MANEAQDRWVLAVFGVNPASFVPAPGQAAAPPGDGLDRKLAELAALRDRLRAAGIDARPLSIQVDDFTGKLDSARHQGDRDTREAMLRDLGTRLDEALAGERNDAAAQMKSSTEGAQKAIKDLLEAAAKEVAKLKDDDPEDYGDLAKRLRTLVKQAGDAARMTDPANRKAALQGIDKDARRLFEDAASMTGNDAAVQRVYEQALKDRYGFAITNPTHTPNTHFDDVYKMFDMVPVDHVVQEGLHELTYIKKKNFARYHTANVKHPETDEHKASIQMGEYGEEPKTKEYIDVVGGTKPKANSFNITALHELGHSVDERWGIMDAHMARLGCGGWQSETTSSVAKAMVADFLANDGQDVALAASLLESIVTNTLDTGSVERPDTIDDDAEWKLVAELLDDCDYIRVKAKAWYNPRKYGDRTYHESYDGEWVSADWSARTNPALMVNKYQWRAPGEFFAELYAFSWYHRKPVSNVVDPAIRQYLYPGS